MSNVQHKISDRNVICFLESQHTIPVTVMESMMLAHWDYARWKELNSIGYELTRILPGLDESKEVEFFMRQFELVDGGNATYGVVVAFVDCGTELNQKSLQTFEVGAAMFVEFVMGQKDKVQRNIMEQSASQELHHKIGGYASNFLTGIGGQTLSTPLKFKTKATEILCSGKFAPRPPVVVAEPHLQSIISHFDGFKTSRRELFIIDGAGCSATIHFNIEKHIATIMKLDPSKKYSFKVAAQLDGGGKETLSLLTIGDELPENDGRLI